MQEARASKLKSLMINISLSLFTIVLFAGLMEGATRVLYYVHVYLFGGAGKFQICYPVLSKDNFSRMFPEPYYKAAGIPWGLFYDLRPGGEGILKGKEVKINSRGFRDYEYYPNKPVDTYRVVVIGDSVTFGYGVDLNESYPKILEKKLKDVVRDKKVEVLNFGVTGYTGAQELIVLKEKALKYNPDLVIFGHHLNDIDEYQTLEVALVPDFLMAFLEGNSYIFNCIKWKNLGSSDTTGSIKEKYREDFGGWLNHRRLLSDIAEVAREKKIPVLFVVLPIWQELEGNYEFEEAHDLLNRTILEAGLYSLDILPRVRGVKTSEYLINSKDYDHPNPKGHEVIADAIYDRLIMEKLLP